jgi:predicted MPP superfamily phosphohydrolase
MNIKNREAILEIFLSIFFLIYTSAHLYVFLKARAALGFGPVVSLSLAVFMLVMIVSPLLVYYSEKYHQEIMARFIAYLGYTWMGALFLFVCAAFITDMYHSIVYLISVLSHEELSYLIPSAKTSFYVPLFVSLTIALYGYFEARNVHTERVAINTSKLPRGMDSLRIVQISDVHLGLIIRKQRLKNIIDKIKEAGPDILVSTGDLVDGQINSLSGLAEMIKEINPKYGSFAITGNHEFYAGIEHAMDFTRKAGFTVLRGEGVTVQGIINIAGVDDPAGKPFGVYREVSEKALLSKFPRDRFTLLLKHRPVVDQESRGLFDLQLSGHTHKGQIFPFSLITKLSYISDAGYLDLGNNSALYVNRGAGTWGPPMRFMSPPEITIIDLYTNNKN